MDIESDKKFWVTIVAIKEEQQEVYDKTRDLYDRKDEAREKFQAEVQGVSTWCRNQGKAGVTKRQGN